MMIYSNVSYASKKIYGLIVMFCLSLLLQLTFCGCAEFGGSKVVGKYFTISSGKPEQLTFGKGNHTEAAWSPDRKWIAFQRELNGDLDIAAVDMKGKTISVLVAGAALACYPAWTLDGALIYSCSERGTLTASELADGNLKCGFGLRLLKDGTTHTLTEGLWRDYTASVSPTGNLVYYSSTRSCSLNNSSMWQLSLDDPSTAAPLLSCVGRNEGIMQPSLSPDGKVLLWSALNGLYSNWRLTAAFKDDPQRRVFLTPYEMSAYAPRWSPDGRLIAFTGFRSGDLGWRIYIMEPSSGAMLALNTGDGNSRSPAWSSDGSEIVYENNMSGSYKLYRIPLKFTFTPFVSLVKDDICKTEVRLQLIGKKALLIDVAGNVLEGVCSGAGSAGDLRLGAKAMFFKEPAGLNYGHERFFVHVKFRMDKISEDVSIVAVGSYKLNPMAWQVFVTSKGFVYFNSRNASGIFIGATSNKPLKPGQTVTVTGMRDAQGAVRLWVDGVLQKKAGVAANFNYAKTLKVSLGEQYNGGGRLKGSIQEFVSGRGWPPGINPPLKRMDLFKEEK